MYRRKLNTKINEYIEALGDIPNVTSMNLNYSSFNIIIPDIVKLTALTELNISNNSLAIISSDIHKLNKLQIFKASYNNIRYIPPQIQYLTDLVILQLDVNRIKTIPVKIKSLTKLQILDLSCNIIKAIPSEIQYLTEITELILKTNKINIIPPEIQYLNKLQYLNLSNNPISELPQEIKYLTRLNSIYLHSTNISIIPPEIQYLVNLKILNFSGCKNIDKIPQEIRYLTNLKNLYLSDNSIYEIPDEIQYLVNLREFIISWNILTSIPISIINLRRLIYFDGSNNEIHHTPPQIMRFLNRIENTYRQHGNNLQVYNDTQNIHNHNIQQSVNTSISNIMKNHLEINEDDIINSIITDTILTTKTKELLMEYSNSDDYHSVLLITFKELLMYVWKLIEENNDKNEIKAILNTEMLDAECKCFTGRLTRLINCLNGFTKLVEIKISDTQQIANVIITIKNNLELNEEYTIEKHKEFVKEELKMRGYEEELINLWVEQIE